MIYRIRKWKEHQHYKDRNPPWIKLKVDILSSRDWIMWSDASRVLAIVCMALASKTEGQIDASEDGLEYIKAAGHLRSKPDLNQLIKSGFLVEVGGASTLLASSASSSVSVSVKSLKTTEDSKSFNKPTLEEIRNYCEERGNRVDPEKWFSYYESNGWRVGRNPMKSWQAAIRTWEKSEFNHVPIEKKEFVI